MSTQLQETPMTSEQVSFLKRHFAPGATDLELEHFIGVCRSRGLRPEAGHIYFAKFKDKHSGQYKVSHITSIDGYRLVAERTGKYAGSSEPTFEFEEDSKDLLSCKITVKKLVGSTIGEFVGKAFLEDQKNLSARDMMWRKSPRVMLEKCAEAKALKKAFPEELGGLSISDECSAPVKVSPDLIEIKEACFDMEDEDRRRGLNKRLSEQGISSDHWDQIAHDLHGTPNSKIKEKLEQILAEKMETQDVIGE